MIPLAMAYNLTILNPTSNTLWKEGKEEFIVWEVTGPVNPAANKVGFFLVDTSQGQNDTPLLSILKEDVEVTEGRTNVTVPKVRDGPVGLQVRGEDDELFFSSSFSMGSRDAEAAEEESSAMITGMMGAFIVNFY